MQDLGKMLINKKGKAIMAFPYFFYFTKINKLYYLTLQRGKRRYPEIVDDNKKYAILPFPSKAPIPPNMCANGEYVGFKYAPTADVIKRLDDEFDL